MYSNKVISILFIISGKFKNIEIYIGSTTTEIVVCNILSYLWTVPFLYSCYLLQKMLTYLLYSCTEIV